MAESLAQQRKKYRNIRDRLAKKYGTTKLASRAPNIELCVYLVLREGWDYRKAGKTVKILGEEYVDWNEVRVSYAKELAESLVQFNCRDIIERLQRMKSVLGEIYNEYNRLQLDFLLEREFEETRKIFAEIEPLGRANAYIFLQCLQEEMDKEADVPATLVMSSEALRVGIRLGLIKKTSSHNVGRKAFSKLFDPGDYITFQNLFVRHAENLCRSKNPLCQECILKNSCDYAG